MSIHLHRMARKDFEKALTYYDEKEGNVGDRFLEEINSYLEMIAENPLRFHFAKKPIRRANLKIFPYNIIYRVDSKQVKVLAIRHNKQHPRRGMRRTM